MNETAAAALLGVVQGLTEFLPVSSSGHLVLFQEHLPVSGDMVAFDLVLHLGTLVPVFIVYRADLLGIIKDLLPAETPLWSRPGVRLLSMVVLGSIPTAFIGLLLQDTFEQLFDDSLSVGIAFAVTGSVLWLTRFAKPGSEDEVNAPRWKALLVGLVQGLAITPGISRSGSTIAAGLFLGLDREAAARLSFLLAIPAIGGAFLLKARHLSTSGAAVLPLIVGFLCAAISGYIALVWLIHLVKSGDFSRFAYYLWPLSAFAIAMALSGPI